jgi:hypothetical protein
MKPINHMPEVLTVSTPNSIGKITHLYRCALAVLQRFFVGQRNHLGLTREQRIQLLLDLIEAMNYMQQCQRNARHAYEGDDGREHGDQVGCNRNIPLVLINEFFDHMLETIELLAGKNIADKNIAVGE